MADPKGAAPSEEQPTAVIAASENEPTALVVDGGKRGPGRPPFEPTDQMRAAVMRAVGYGMTQEEVVLFLDIDRKTLRKHFQKELKAGKAVVKREVLTRLRDKIREGDSASIFFFLKTQCGWRETQHVDLSVDYRRLSDEELLTIVNNSRAADS